MIKNEISYEELVDLYVNKKLPCKEIAKIYECSEMSINRRLKRNNINIRKRSHIDLIGKKFHKLTVIDISNRTNKHIIWNCICECGRTKNVLSHNLINSGVRHCGECTTRWKNFEGIPYEFFNKIKYDAKNRDLEFSITIEYILDLFIEQDKKCALSGIDLRMGNHRRATGDRTASLDRIDSSKGYIEGNVQWVHKCINYMKMDLQDKDFIYFCNQVSSFQNNKEGKINND